MHRFKVTLFAAAGLLMANPLAAQNGDAINTYSPYSLYGVGELASPGFSYQRGMGGIGIGLQTNRTINYINPAALTVQDTLSFMFDFGGEMQNYYLFTSQNSTASNSFNMNHLAMSFPIWRRTVVALSVMPYSSVGYKITQKETDPAVLSTAGDVTYTHQGEGGFNQIMLSLGYSLDNLFRNPVLRRFSIGGQAQYIFGSIDRYDNVSFSNSSVAGNNTGRLIRADDFTFGLGLQYSQPVGKYHLAMGATYQFANNMKVTQTNFAYALRNAIDTGRYEVNRDARLQVPAALGVGISLRQAAQWLVGVDYTYRDWRNAMFDLPTSQKFTTRSEHIVRAGFERTPNRYDIRYFLKRWSYRGGLFYEKTYMQFGSTRINNYGATVGVGIPIGNRNNALNLSAEVGQRGTTDNDLIRELYWKVSLSVSLYDIWFVKPKFE